MKRTPSSLLKEEGRTAREPREEGTFAASPPCLHCHRTPSSTEREPDTARKKPATSLVAVSAVGCHRHPCELPPHRRY
ncbi:hypothetical protein AHAS_Ahas13G0291300 [Arachis hypogaea]